MSENKNILKAILQQKDLNYILSNALSVIDKQSVINELNNVKLVAKGNSLEIGATDLDIYLNQSVGAQVEKEGETTVSAKIFSEIIRKIPDKEITIVQEEGSEYLKIIGSSCKFDLLTLPTDKFPQMEDLKNSDNVLNISCEELARIIRHTNFAISEEETRYNLTGIYLHIKNGTLTSAATDAHRLSVAASSTTSKAKDFGVIIPKKTVNELLRVLKDPKNSSSEVLIKLAPNKVQFECNNIIIVSKLIDGNFPEYESFIPANNSNKMVINAKLLESAIGRVETVTVDKFRAVKLTFNKSELTITASGETKGMASESIIFSEDDEKYCQFNGSDLTIGFNPKYITDVLTALKEKKVQLYLNDSSSPVLIKVEDNPKDNFVIMPVKV